jgi:two-component system alkaline phosphatase synthesis response regulator PhoP
MKKKILLVEDEPGLRLTLTDRLGAEGYEVATAADGPEGLHRAWSQAYDLLILDIMLPGKSGLDVCRELRQRGVETPVLMLTARGQVQDRVVGLKLGADDYLTKPFEMAELLARIEARLRRGRPAEAASPEAYKFGNVRVNFKTVEVEREGMAVDLSTKEFQLLKYLIQHRGTVVTRDELLDTVWGYDKPPSTRTVDVHVAWLRRKIEPQAHLPQYILTVHGIGYKFVG